MNKEILPKKEIRLRHDGEGRKVKGRGLIRWQPDRPGKSFEFFQ